MRFLPLIILLILFSSVALQGQRCKSAIYLDAHRDRTPHLESQRLAFNQLLQNQIKSRSHAKRNTLVTLPLVFHVLYNTNAQNIDSLQIASQIDVINEDFRLQNANKSILQGGFVNLATDVEIEFKLATTDPDGNPTNGITRKFTSNPAIGGSNFEYYDLAQGGVPAWDPEHYINIWVLNINSAGGDFGFATFPGEADPISSDGIVIDFKYLGTLGTASNSSPQHLGRTLTHELGHYFGLEHIWGDVDDCSRDDQIADTPLQETSTDGCRTYPAYDLCSTSGDGVNFYNYMDYTDDECMAMFTADQVNKIRAVLSIPFASGGRSELIELFSSNTTLAAQDLNVFPNPAFHSIRLELDNQDLFGKTLSIFNIKGQRIDQYTIQSQDMDIDLSRYEEGVYLFQVIGNKNIWSQIIVKMP